MHIHSRHSRATSKELSIDNLEKYAKIKGLNLLGTGDFTHHLWLKELKEKLKEENGILKTANGFNFVLQTELSLIYTQDGKGRRIHNVILAPSFDVVEQINEALGKKGRLDYDGRPIFNFSCVELVEMMRSISEDIEIIPAHIWTPWFSLFGSMSGFDSIEQAFKEKTKYIHALETGLSSDPEMNWRLSSLDRYTLTSNSDLHSFWPWRIGRECNIFDIDLTYKNLLNVLKTRQGFVETIEVDPAYGKYHFDGHRACSVCMNPEDSLKNKNICPKCGRKLTIGVLHRVKELADRPEGFKLQGAVPFKRIIPLSEILSVMLKSGIATKKTWQEYHKILKLGSEMDVLLDVPFEKLKTVTDEKIAEAIIKNRDGEIVIQPGFDGVYGKALFDEKEIVRSYELKQKQTGLDDFMKK